jgi:hypothetical protein
MRLASAFHWLLIASLVCAAGCASENKGKIEGTKWRSCASTVKGQALSEGFLRLHFKADGGILYRAGAKTLTGTYKLGSGKTVVMNMNSGSGGTERLSETVEISGGRLTMTDSDGTVIAFNKDK